MMKEKDETQATAQSLVAFEDVEWALQQMPLILREHHEKNKHSQGGEDESDLDPNTQPKKRYV
jgi:hypothetical protein